MRTNLITNPAMRAGSGSTSVEIRRNYCTNPNFETGSTGWLGTGTVVATISQDTTVAYMGSASLKTVTSGSGSFEGCYYSPQTVTGIVQGASFTVSAWVLAPAGASLRVEAISIGTGSVNGATLFTGTGAWQRVFSTGTMGASLDPYMIVRTQTAQAITFWVDGALIEKSAGLLPYFDGATATFDGLTCSWVGAANASQSIAKSPFPSDFSADRSAAQVSLGPGADAVDAYGNYFYTTNPFAGSAVGNYYSAKVTLSAPAVDGLSQTRSTTACAIHDGSNYIAQIPASVTLPADGTQVTIDVVATAPVGTSNAPRFYVYGASARPRVRIHNIVVEQVSGPGKRAGAYFDGNTLNCEWTGPVDASTSLWKSLSNTVIRANRCANPSPVSPGTGWSGNAGTGGSATVSFITGSGCPVTDAARTLTWTAGATSGAGGQNYSQPAGSASPGQTWSASGWTRYNRAATLYCTLFAVDSTGALIASSVGPNVAVAANTWTKFEVDGWVTPTGTDHLLFLIYCTAPLTGDVQDMTGVLLEQAPVAGSYFDGSSANADWDGATGASTSQMMVTSQNTNWPVVGWEVFTQENPPPAPYTTGPTTAPTMLADRTRSIKISRGRQYELDQDEAATGEARVINDDGGMTAGSDGRYPMRFARCTATWQGKNYPLYTGFVSAWPDSSTDPATGEAEISFVDLFEAYANRPLMSLYREALQAMTPPPDHLWPFSEPAGATATTDVIGTNANPTSSIVAYKGGDPGTLGFGGTGICVQDSSTCLTNDNTSGATGKASQVQFNGPNVPNGGPVIDTTKPWLATFWLKATGGKSSAFSVLDPAGNVFASISFDATAWTVTYVVGGQSVTWNAGQAYLGGGIHVGIGYDGTNGVYIEEGQNGSLTGYTASPYGKCSWIAAGACFNSTAILNGGNSTYVMQYLALWTSGAIPPLGLNGQILDSYYGGATAWANSIVGGSVGIDQPAMRIKRIQGWAQQTGLNGDTPALGMGRMADSTGSGALDLIRQATLDAGGRFFIDPSGMPTFYDKNHGQTLTSPKYVFGSNTGAGELPYTGGPGFDFDTTHIYNDVQVSLNSTDVNDAGLYRWKNTASIAKYFTRVLQVTSGLFYQSDGLALAQYLANRYAEPDYRIGDVVLDPAANPSLWPVVLGIGLQDLVQVNHRDLNGTRSGLYQVAKIQHETEGGESWKTTLSLTPFHRYWLVEVAGRGELEVATVPSTL